jgi:hypothetical protein
VIDCPVVGLNFEARLPFAAVAIRRASTGDSMVGFANHSVIPLIVAGYPAVVNLPVANPIEASRPVVSRFEVNHQPDCSPSDCLHLAANHFGTCRQETVLMVIVQAVILGWWLQDFER